MNSFEVKNLPLADLNLPTRWWRDVPLFSISDSAVLLSYCANMCIGVLGVEGFRLEQGHRIPDMDCIADLSVLKEDEAFCEKSIEAARRFLECIPPDVFLEFVLATAKESRD